MAKTWKFRAVEDEAVRRLSQTLGLSPLLAQLLQIRGIQTPEAARPFLAPSDQAFDDPFLFSEMNPAVERILAAVGRGERMVVYGDYDVDGITATCILLETLWSLEATVESYLPDRLNEGYGLQEEAIRNLAGGCDLLITVDCGATAVAETRLARELGMDVIITDHHDPGDERPPATAVLNPIFPNESYPNKYLSGSGVAWKLACALREKAGRPEPEDHLLELAALGLIADVMPLVGENRILVARAL